MPEMIDKDVDIDRLLSEVPPRTLKKILEWLKYEQAVTNAIIVSGTQNMQDANRLYYYGGMSSGITALHDKVEEVWLTKTTTNKQ